MADLMIVLVVAAIVGGAGRYVYKSKQSGAKCIGCPVEGGCAGCGRSCANQIAE